ncbi:prepilin-type N-terminal cleavage/methylation domain-containing protein [Thermomonas sp.]|uniref:PilW family protein n=1 Tax=Thermomonas sp. TaxID=1971895 RepID=UPI0026384546|nr:prepilin-type N-terminal cleavage/methylation domain-containing protein [Thermomonas sp.]MCO5054795.1 prepilin-type N-terminal cleavage/methylation domain-containing protein [Thermomonas sp.]HRO63650.1 prepilin-type N-terminal cleavage/methylation domain-containing protein [Thermomonas sp.]
MSRFHSKAAAQGFSLIEMMIALMLGLIVLGAAFVLFVGNLRTFNSNDGQNRVQENARVAYEMLAADVRSTGTTACTRESSVRGVDANSAAFRAPLDGTATSLTAVGVDEMAYRVDPNNSDANRVTLLEASPAASDIFNVNDVVMVCNGSMTGFATVGSISGQQVNFSAKLPFNPADTVGASPASISIGRLRTTTWSVAPNGGPTGSSLYVDLNDGAGNQEAAVGIQPWTLLFHQAQGGNASVYAPATGGSFSYQNVDAVNMLIPIRAIIPGNAPGESNQVNRTIAATVAIRNRTP